MNLQTVDKEIGKRIKSRRLELRLSQDEVAQKLKYNGRSSISKIERGERSIPLSKVEEFARVLDTTTAFLMGWKSAEDKAMEEAIPIQSKSVPVLGGISCGKPRYTNEEIGYADYGMDDRADFCLVAKGDSMVGARIYDGDIVFVRKQSMVENGDIAVVVIDDEATLKRVYYDSKNHRLMLQAENPKYQPLIFVNDELKKIAILGKAVAVHSKL